MSTKKENDQLVDELLNELKKLDMVPVRPQEATIVPISHVTPATRAAQQEEHRNKENEKVLNSMGKRKHPTPKVKRIPKVIQVNWKKTED